MNTVRWGLLSTARINRRLIPAIRASKRGKLVAVASRDQERVDAYAKERGIPQTFASYEAMLESPEVDAVYISLPNHLHAEWTVRALQAGKHVLCEKPFAITVDEVDRMIAASRETGCVLQEAFMYRHHPQTKMIGEWVREGRLGEVLLVRGMFSFFMGNRPGNVRLVPEYGGGSLWDVGVYPLSFAQFVLGRTPRTVTASQWIGETGVDEVFAGQMDYGGGVSAQIACGFHLPFETRFEVHGTLGRLVATRPFLGISDRGSSLVFTPSEGKDQKLPVPKLDPYLGEVEDMHAAILDGQPPLIKLEESRDHIRTALALYRSAQTGQLVHLEA